MGIVHIADKSCNHSRFADNRKSDNTDTVVLPGQVHRVKAESLRRSSPKLKGMRHIIETHLRAMKISQPISYRLDQMAYFFSNLLRRSRSFIS